MSSFRNRRKVPIFLLLLVVIGGGVLVWYFSRGAKAPVGVGRTLSVAIEAELGSIDPLKSTENSIARMAGQCLETLVGIDEAGALQPRLAVSWAPEEGGRRWVLKLREGARFHTSKLFGPAGSRTMDAEDVVFSFRRVLASDSVFSFAFAGILEGAEDFRAGKTSGLPSVRARGPLEVEFALTRPDPEFLRRCTAPWTSIVPREQATVAAAWGRSELVGTGPFQFESMTDTALRLRRNPGAWDAGKGNLDVLEFVTIKNEPLRIDALRAGRVQAVYATPRQLQSIGSVAGGRLELRPELKELLALSSFDTLNSHFIGFNCAKIDAPTRKVLSSLVDRAGVVGSVLPAGAIPNDLPVPLSMLEKVPPPAAPLTAALEVKTIEVLVHDQQSAPEYVEAAVAGWNKVGVKAVLKTLGLPALIDRVVRGDFEAAAMWYEYPFSSPGLILGEFYGPQRRPMPNFFAYENAAFTEFLLRVSTGESAGRGALTEADAAQLASIIREDPPGAFLFQRKVVILHRQNCSGFALDVHSIPRFAGVTLR